MLWFFEFDKIPLRDKIRTVVVQIALASDRYYPEEASLRSLLDEKKQLAKANRGVTALFFNCDINPTLLAYLQDHNTSDNYCALKLRLHGKEKLYVSNQIKSAVDIMDVDVDLKHKETASNLEEVVLYVMSSQWHLSDMEQVIYLCADGNEQYEVMLRRKLYMKQSVAVVEASRTVIESEEEDEDNIGENLESHCGDDGALHDDTLSVVADVDLLAEPMTIDPLLSSSHSMTPTALESTTITTDTSSDVDAHTISAAAIRPHDKEELTSSESDNVTATDPPCMPGSIPSSASGGMGMLVPTTTNTITTGSNFSSVETSGQLQSPCTNTFEMSENDGAGASDVYVGNDTNSADKSTEQFEQVELVEKSTGESDNADDIEFPSSSFRLPKTSSTTNNDTSTNSSSSSCSSNNSTSECTSRNDTRATSSLIASTPNNQRPTIFDFPRAIIANDTISNSSNRTASSGNTENPSPDPKSAYGDTFRRIDGSTNSSGNSSGTGAGGIERSPLHSKLSPIRDASLSDNEEDSNSGISSLCRYLPSNIPDSAAPSANANKICNTTDNTAGGSNTSSSSSSSSFSEHLSGATVRNHNQYLTTDCSGEIGFNNSNTSTISSTMLTQNRSMANIHNTEMPNCVSTFTSPAAAATVTPQQAAIEWDKKLQIPTTELRPSSTTSSHAPTSSSSSSESQREECMNYTTHVVVSNYTNNAAGADERVDMANKATSIIQSFGLKVVPSFNARKQNFQAEEVATIERLLLENYGNSCCGLWLDDSYPPPQGRPVTRYDYLLEMTSTTSAKKDTVAVLVAICTLTWQADSAHWLIGHVCMLERSVGFGPIFINLMKEWLKATHQSVNILVDISDTEILKKLH